MGYAIHKGVCKTVEFLGLKSQYLIGFCAGVMGLFILFVVLSAVHIPLFIIILIVGVSLGGLLRYVFSFNKKYGQYGLMKESTRKRYPRFMTSRKSFYQMLQISPKRDG